MSPTTRKMLTAGLALVLAAGLCGGEAPAKKVIGKETSPWRECVSLFGCTFKRGGKVLTVPWTTKIHIGTATPYGGKWKIVADAG